MSLDLADDKSTLVQVIVWCCQAASHYLSQCLPSSLSPYGITRLQWVNCFVAVRYWLIWSISFRITMKEWLIYQVKCKFQPRLCMTKVIQSLIHLTIWICFFFIIQHWSNLAVKCSLGAFFTVWYKTIFFTFLFAVVNSITVLFQHLQ